MITLKTQSTLEGIVLEYVRAKDMFTVGEINSVAKSKDDTTAYDDVREFVHEMFYAGRMGIAYKRTSVAFLNGEGEEVSAYVYHPQFSDPYKYVSHEKRVKTVDSVTDTNVGRFAAPPPDASAPAVSTANLIDWNSVLNKPGTPAQAPLTSVSVPQAPPASVSPSIDATEPQFASPSVNATKSQNVVYFDPSKPSGVAITSLATAIATNDPADILYSVDTKGRIVIDASHIKHIVSAPEGTVYALSERKRMTIVADGDSHRARVTILKLDAKGNLRLPLSVLRDSGITTPLFKIEKDEDALYIMQSR